MSSGIAALVAQVAFWTLLAWAWYDDDLGTRGVTGLVAAWIAGWLGLPVLTYQAEYLFSSYVALLDIFLVFVVFKGDVRLS